MLFLAQPLEPSPRRLTRLLAASSGELEVADHAVDVDVLGILEGVIGFSIFELVGLGLLAHRLNGVAGNGGVPLAPFVYPFPRGRNGFLSV